MNKCLVIVLQMNFNYRFKETNLPLRYCRNTAPLAGNSINANKTGISGHIPGINEDLPIQNLWKRNWSRTSLLPVIVTRHRR
jgi:hypothetical protein